MGVEDVNTNNPVVATEAITKAYEIGKNVVEALRGVSLNINSGEFVVVSGASGSGKSSLLQIIGGLDKPTRGNIIIDGSDIGKLHDKKLSRFRSETIGFVFQFFYLQPYLTLEQNIAVPGMFARMKKNERTERVRELAAMVGLEDRLRHKPSELSGGQIQRAAVLRALLNSPKILLADEPTGNLDSENSIAIIDLFIRLRDELGMTIVIATHDAEIAARADRVITLRDGAIV